MTTGLDGRQIDHVAIYHNAGGKGFALEAIHKGVCLTPIDSFMARRHVVVVGQLKDTVGVEGGEAQAEIVGALLPVGKPARKRHHVAEVGVERGAGAVGEEDGRLYNSWNCPARR